MTLDKMLNELEEKRIEDLERDMLGYDEDVGYYNYDDWSTNTTNRAFYPKALNSY